MLFLCARHVILYLVLVQPRIRPDIAGNFLTGMGGSRGGGGDRGSRQGVQTLPKDHKNRFS